MTGPNPSSRERTISASAASRVHARRANSSGAAIGGASSTCSNNACTCGSRSAATQMSQPLAGSASDASGFGSIDTRVARPSRASASRYAGHPSLRADLRRRDESESEQRVVHFVGIARLGPRLGAHALDRRGVERAEGRRRFLVEPAPRHHRLRATLFERRIVEIRVRSRGEDLERERRRRRELARDDLDLAGLDAA